MSLHKRKKPAVIEDELTASAASLIYKELENGKRATELFMQGVPFAHTARVVKEFEATEREVSLIMGGQKLKTKATYNKQGEIATEAVYCAIPDTQAELVAMIHNDLLDTAEIVDDVRRYNNNDLDRQPAWKEFKASFNKTDE